MGLLYLKEGAAAINAPVLHPSQAADGSLILQLGAWQGAWSFVTAGTVEARERIDRPELREALCVKGPLSTLTPP